MLTRRSIIALMVTIGASLVITGVACSGSEAEIGQGASVRRMAELPRNHIGSGEGHIAYNSVPATSGPHFGQPLEPASWGVHEIVLPDEVLLHNLEHGGISVTYNCPNGCGELAAQLSELANNAVNDSEKVILSPYPDMETRIALTAWTFIDQFEEFDEGRIQDFVNTHESSSDAPEPNVQ